MPRDPFVAEGRDPDRVLTVQDLTVRIQGRLTLNGVSLQVARGEIVGLLGPNGAGKTTCFRAILGQIGVHRGAVRLEGEEISSLPMHMRARRGIGYLPQETSVFRGLTVAQNLLAVLQIRGNLRRRGRAEELDRLLEELQISHLRDARGATLSGGERRRVEIARALAAAPRHMLLDEPFAGVDPVSIVEIQRLIRDLAARGIGVLLTDHNVREALSLCDRAYVLSKGSILASGVPGEIVRDDNVRGIYLGQDFELRAARDPP